MLGSISKHYGDHYGNTEGNYRLLFIVQTSRLSLKDKKSRHRKREVLKIIHENKDLGWQFVDSKKELRRWCTVWEYYLGYLFAQRIPRRILLSCTSGDIKKPEIEYKSMKNQCHCTKKSQDKGASTIQSQISIEFIPDDERNFTKSL